MSGLSLRTWEEGKTSFMYLSEKEFVQGHRRNESKQCLHKTHRGKKKQFLYVFIEFLQFPKGGIIILKDREVKSQWDCMMVKCHIASQ